MHSIKFKIKNTYVDKATIALDENLLHTLEVKKKDAYWSVAEMWVFDLNQTDTTFALCAYISRLANEVGHEDHYELLTDN